MLPPNSQLPNKDSFEEWKAQPFSQFFFHVFLKASEQSFKDQWAAGQFTGDILEKTMVANMQAVAAARVYKELSELDYESFIEVLRDE